jgi:hypothetical protein
MNLALATIWRRDLNELSKSGCSGPWLGPHGLIASACLSENLFVSQQWSRDKGTRWASHSGWRKKGMPGLDRSFMGRKPWW